MIEASRALERLLTARARIVRIATEWQARGIDTSALAPSLVELQEAIYLVETLITDESDEIQLGRLGRELRDHFDAVRASGAGLDTEEDHSKRLRWLDLIERAADHCIATVDRMEPLFADD
jgi:hypothetical protein